MKTDFFSLLNCGKIEFAAFYSVAGKKYYAKETALIKGKETLHWQCVYENGAKDDFYFTKVRTGFTCIRMFENGSERLELEELGLTVSGINFGAAPENDYFYHNENPRIYEKMTFPIDYKRAASDASDSEFDEQAGNRWADPGVVCERIGRSPYQPFPAIHLGNYSHKHGLVHGTLLQDVFYHNYLVNHKDSAIVFDIFSSFKALDWMEVGGKEILRDEWYIGPTEHSDDIELIFSGYTEELRKKLPANYGATHINRDCLVWGSWNDGIFRNVNEALVLREAEFIKDNFPTVRWIQLDDGYGAFDISAHGIGIPYEGEAGIDHEKFPQGLRHYTDKLRELGMRPAVWIGGFCNRDSKIYKEKPQWFCDYSLRTTHANPLDVSQKEVRDYMTHALDVLITEYGFEAVKHDFWSYAFEDSHPLLKEHKHSGYYYRDWWLKELRRRIAPDGYLQTGCDIVMGNPFLGKYFTNYRYGIDISDGNWDFVKTNFLWGIACFATHTNDLFVPNSDSIGIFPVLNDTDLFFALNYCIVTRSMVEIAGKLSQNADNSRMKYLKRAACCVNNGQELFFAKYDYRRKGRVIPNIIYFMSAQFSAKENNSRMPLRTVGIFNADDTELTVSFSAEDLKLDGAKSYIAYNIWTGEEYALDGGSLEFTLKPHGSELISVAENAPFTLIDADIEVKSAEHSGNALKLSFRYAKQNARLMFTAMPAEILRSGAKVPFTADGKFIAVDIEADCVYEFRF